MKKALFLITLLITLSQTSNASNAQQPETLLQQSMDNPSILLNGSDNESMFHLSFEVRGKPLLSQALQKASAFQTGLTTQATITFNDLATLAQNAEKIVETAIIVNAQIVEIIRPFTENEEKTTKKNDLISLFFTWPDPHIQYCTQRCIKQMPSAELTEHHQQKFPALVQAQAEDRIRTLKSSAEKLSNIKTTFQALNAVETINESIIDPSLATTFWYPRVTSDLIKILGPLQ